MQRLRAYGYIGMVTVVGAAALMVAALVMRLSTPLDLGPLGVTAWFLVVLIGLSGVCAALAYGLAAVLTLHHHGKSRFNLRPPIDASRRGILLGGSLTILLALSSLRQLNLRDVILLVLLLGLVEFYTVART
jgi:hypothetical protein